MLNSDKYVKYYIILAILSLPLSYYFFSIYSDVNLRCHIPSFNGVNFVFEIIPYIFVIASGILSILFGLYALRSTGDITENTLSLIFAFMFNVFSFSLIYKIFGISLPPEIMVNLLPENYNIRSIDIEIGGVFDRIDMNGIITTAAPRSASAELPNPEDSFIPPIILRQISGKIVSSDLSYLFYSLSNAIPGAQPHDYKVCGSGSPFVIIQNGFGILMTVIFSLYLARVNKILN